MTTDAELIRAARSDPGAFRELYDRYAVRVYRFQLGRSRDAEAAHDLTAETFAQDLARTNPVPGRGGRIRWPLALRDGSQPPLDLGPPRAARTGGDRAARDPRTGLDEALAELPESQLDALRLRFDEDLPYDELAALVPRSPGVAVEVLPIAEL